MLGNSLNCAYDQVNSIETYYQRIYFNALDTVINAIKENAISNAMQNGYANHAKIEQLLFCAADNRSSTSWLSKFAQTMELINILAEINVAKYFYKILLNSAYLSNTTRLAKNIK